MAASSGSGSVHSVDLTDSQPTETSETVKNALSLLRSPQASDLARSRVVASNKKHETKRGRGKGANTVLKSNFVEKRIKEYKHEPSRKSNNKLFCEACREELSEKSSIIDISNQVNTSQGKRGSQKRRGMPQ